VSDGAAQEIVIIRRGSHAHEEGHHGGVWKIAFADFMTAMMAFFLVLWIVNSSSKETRASIARYFNPVKLSDTTPARKGLKDAKALDFDARDDDPNKPANSGEEECGGGKDTNAGKPHDAHGAKDAHGGKGKDKAAQGGCGQAAPKPRFSEDQLMSEPQAVLTSIVAADAAVRGRRLAEGERTGETAIFPDPNGRPGLVAEPVFRDPFAPVSPVLAARSAGEGHPVLKAPPQAPAPASPAPSSAPVSSRDLTPSPSGPAGQSEPSNTGDSAEAAAPTASSASEVGASGISASSQVTPTPAAVGGPSAAPPPASQPVAAAGAGQRPATLPATTAAEIKSEIDLTLKDELKRSGPAVEIRAESEGTLISLTDGLDFGMFAIGSAVPQARTIAIMEKIAAVLKRHEGAIVVRGHTDARPYAGAAYDNWHLSSDRAQIAWHMLQRGGLEARRLERIEGHADRLLRNKADPGAAENRRIEILLKAAPPAATSGGTP